MQTEQYGALYCAGTLTLRGTEVGLELSARAPKQTSPLSQRFTHSFTYSRDVKRGRRLPPRRGRKPAHPPEVAETRLLFTAAGNQNGCRTYREECPTGDQASDAHTGAGQVASLASFTAGPTVTRTTVVTGTVAGLGVIL